MFSQLGEMYLCMMLKRHCIGNKRVYENNIFGASLRIKSYNQTSAGPKCHKKIALSLFSKPALCLIMGLVVCSMRVTSLVLIQDSTPIFKTGNSLLSSRSVRSSRG